MSHPASSLARPLRLLLVTNALEVGGAERHVVDLAVALRRKGYEVTIACSVSGSLAGPLEEAGVPVRPLVDRKVKRRVGPAYAWRLRRLVRGARFDLVHAHVYASAAATALSTWGTGVPFVVTEHTEALWQGKAARSVSQFVYRWAGRIIAVSGRIRRRLIERDGVRPNLIMVVPNAVTTVVGTQASPEMPPGLREGPLVGIVARLQPDKGLFYFLKAAARVVSLFPEARFAVVGDGPLRGELEALAERLGLRVYFLGFRPDAREIAGLMDVLVVPSFTEGSPLVVLEAMVAGVPVVASEVGGIPDQIRHEGEGFLVPPGDPVALGGAIIGLLRDPAYARSLGEADRRRAGLGVRLRDDGAPDRRRLPRGPRTAAHAERPLRPQIPSDPMNDGRYRRPRRGRGSAPRP